MSPLELLAPEADTVPFSVRLAERRLTGRLAAARSDRRAHLRRSVTDLEWLDSVRLTGGTGYGASLVDLSEAGALLEVDSPLRPGVILTLELSGPGIDTTVPLEVLRCYISTLRGETAMYRGACVFAHLIEIPGARRAAREVAAREVAPMPAFVGADAALEHLLDRSSAAPEGGSGLALARGDVLEILNALHARTAARGNDALNRYTSDLLGSVLPALRGGSSRDAVAAALELRQRAMPRRWQRQLEPTVARLLSLIERCTIVAPPPVALPVSAAAALEDPPAAPSSAEPAGPIVIADHGTSAFQKIVVRYADGKILKGHVQDFHPARPQFSLWPSISATPRERVVVPVARLKAVFFVRDFNGNPGYRGQTTAPVRGQGRRVEVTFNDGESITGTTLNYRPDGQGFFVSPADPADNNTRIFVVAAALKRVRFL
jgi:hypothetical protein